MQVYINVLDGSGNQLANREVTGRELLRLLEASEQVDVLARGEVQAQVRADRPSRLPLQDLASMILTAGGVALRMRGHTALSTELLREPWHSSLFKRVADVEWGDDHIATRVGHCLENTMVTHLAHAVVIGRRTGSYCRFMRLRDPRRHSVARVHLRYNPLRRHDDDVDVVRVKNYGRGCHERVTQVLTCELGQEPSTIDLTDFPWEHFEP